MIRAIGDTILALWLLLRGVPEIVRILIGGYHE